MFQRILIGVDDSEPADVAVSFACALADRFRSTVHLVHVNEFTMGSRGIPLRTDEEATDLVLQAAQPFRTLGLTVSGSVRRACPRDVAGRIADAASEFAADVIVLGSNRRRRFRPFRSRQVRERTTRITAVPVIAAPAPLSLPVDGRLSVPDLTADRHSDTLAT
jgi:nucleotide-binding universal stress UspA family protein